VNSASNIISAFSAFSALSAFATELLAKGRLAEGRLAEGRLAEGRLAEGGLVEALLGFAPKAVLEVGSEVALSEAAAVTIFARILEKFYLLPPLDLVVVLALLV